MKKTKLTHEDFKGLTHELCRQISASNWRPDYVVGITRGGLIPATMISHYFDVPMHTLNVSLREDNLNSPESNLWMAEDAFGYVPADEQELYKSRWDISRRKNILIVDDINDSGATFNWIMRDWQSGCLPNESTWDTVWNKNVRFAVLVDNLSSNCDVGMYYFGTEIDKNETPGWVIFPWENWWR